MPINGRLRDGRPYCITKQSTNVKNPLPFTEDGVPITVIYVSNLPNRISKHNLFQIFQHFGDLADCYVRYCNVKATPLFAFVTFRRTEDALRAQCSLIHINFKYLRISQADFWHQGKNNRQVRLSERILRHSKFKKEKDCDSPSEEIVDTSEETQYNILSVLNEDCFMKILSYLPLHELIRSERTCKRWQYLVQQKLQYIHEWKTNEWKCYIPLKPFIFQKLLMKFGAYLKVLHINQDWSMFNERTPYLIGKYCPNLTELVVMSLDSNQWRGVISKCNKLKSLCFEFCSDISDQTFQNCKANLDKLMIRDTQNTIGSFLKNVNFQNLRKLSLINITIKEKAVLEGFSRLKDLQQLSLNRCYIGDKFVNRVLKMLPNLKELSLCCLNMQTSCLEPIFDLKQLEVLRLHMNSAVTNYLIEKICKNCPNLTTLDISIRCNKFWHTYQPFIPAVDDRAFNHIWKLENLEYLDVSGLNITDSAFLALNKNGSGSNLRVLSCRHNSNITERSLIHLIAVCPEITKIDVFNCLNLDREFIEIFPMYVDLSQRKKVLQLNMSSLDSPENPYFPVGSLRVTFERIDPVFLLSCSDFSETDDENFLLDLLIDISDDDSIFSL